MQERQIGRIVWTDYVVNDLELSNGEAEERKVYVRASARMKNGEKRHFFVEGTEPYFWIPSGEKVPEYGFVEYTEEGYESIFDDDLKKVVTEVPNQVGDIEEQFSWSGEADIPYYRRVAIHDGLSGNVALPEETGEEIRGKELIHIDDIDTDPDFEKYIEPRVLIGDIEVSISEDETFQQTRLRASQPINVICAYDNYENDYSVFFFNKYDNLEEPDEIRSIFEEQMGEDYFEFTKVDINFYDCPSEAELLNEFIDYVRRRDFDLTSGWNWIDFDNEYLWGRMQVVDGVNHWKISPFKSSAEANNDQMLIPGLPAFDMMKAFCDKMTFTNWRSQSLDYVSNEELGIGKVDDVDINEDWKNDPEKLIGYNVVDVALTVALDETNDIHGFFYEVGDVCSIPVYDTFYEKRQVDGYILSRRNDDEVFPTAEGTDEISNAGGYVEDPVNGMKEDIGVSDLKSLYPSTMITWNMSTETIYESPRGLDNYVKVPKVPEPKDVRGEIREEDIDWDWLYCSLEEEGIIPRTLKKLFRKRNYEKAQRNEYDPEDPEYNMWDRKQAATKVIMNSFYGNASSKYWRGSNQNGKHLGDAVTSGARYTLWKGKQSIKDAGYEGVYGDTDSHFIQLTEDTLEDQIDELKEISARMDEDASNIAQEIGMEGKHPFLIDSELHGDEYTCMVWEPEKIYDRWMQLGTKKRYAGNIKWKEGNFFENGKTSISGFEFRRADSMEVTAELQKKVIAMILDQKGFEEVSDYIRGIIDRIDEDYDNIKEFALPGSINKPLEEYPNRQVPRAAEYSNEHLGYEFGEGDDPFVYFVQSTPPGLPNTDVVAFQWNEEIPDGFELDEEAIIERGIEKPIETIIEEVDWKFSEIRSGKKQKTEGLGSLDGSNPFA